MIQAIQGAGDNQRYRASMPVEFGTDEWRKQRGMGRGPARRSDQAHRAKRVLRQAVTVSGLWSWDEARETQARMESAALEAWERDTERLASEYAQELHTAGPRWNAKRAAAVVKVSHAGLTEADLVALISHGFAWSHRRGGMWWANRTELSETIACSICQKEF